MHKKVALAVSGGIDSAISAFKLKKLGLEVIGINFKFWKWENNSPESPTLNIALLEDIGKIIGFEIHILEYEKYFKDTIVDRFISELSSGQTPNPCVMCNPLVKFKLLKDFADKEKIDFISTGHYARVEKDKEDVYKLMKGIDRKKDQSYVLCYLTQELLSRAIFPMGETYKVDNVEIAKQLDLKSVQVGESQDLCFVSPDHYQQFIRESLPTSFAPGDIVDINGTKLGIHSGLALYTIGQRKGIKVSAEKPYYVMKKDLSTNQLIVGHLEELGNSKLVVDDVNWINPVDKATISCDVKIRYRSQPIKCKIKKGKGNEYLVTLIKEMRDITPGQYAVFYNGEEVLGGGVITEIKQ